MLAVRVNDALSSYGPPRKAPFAGGVFSGVWRHGAPLLGVYQSKDVRYSGEMSHGLFDGYGLYACGGTTYKGEFVAGKRDGLGCFVTSNAVQRGLFRDNRCVHQAHRADLAEIDALADEVSYIARELADMCELPASPWSVAELSDNED
jgi:hypothetical protein